mgnify:CR=1 FL=1
MTRDRAFAEVIAGCATTPSGPDYAREKRWADEITPTLVVGDPVYIAQPGGHRFLALYTEAKPSRAAVIVVHGLGIHPDWALIGALRSDLPDAGYTTLSVQMPVLAADALAESYGELSGDASERLAVATAFLRTKGYRKIALVSHSMGARMVNHYLVNGGAGDIDAWVALERQACAHELHAWTPENYRSSLRAGYWSRALCEPETGAVVAVCVAMDGVDEIHLLNIAKQLLRSG